MRAGRGVVFEISSVTKPSHSGSNGVTLVMIPQRAYVLLPTQIVRTLRGIRKYSMERASANEFGGTTQTGPVNSTNDLGSNSLGSTIAESAFVKILNSGATRMSYPYDETPYEITPARTWASAKGSIMRWSLAMRRIQRSDLMDMGAQCNGATVTYATRFG